MSGRSRKSKAASSDSGSTITSSKHVTVQRSETFADKDRSPSPLNITRIEEKDELAHLNDRLASYIDYVRQLERDKKLLTSRIKTVTEERLEKVEDIKRTYEDEIKALRSLVDDLGKQKGSVEFEFKKFRDDVSDMKNKLGKKENEVRALQRKVDGLERDLNTYKHNHERFIDLKPEFDELEKRYAITKKELDGETVLRTNLENKVIGLLEEIDFKNRLFDEQHQKVVQRSITVEENLDEVRETEFQNRLADELRAIRSQTAEELENYKYEMEETFQQKVEQLRSTSLLASNGASEIKSELSAARRRADDLSQDLARKEAEFNLLHRRIAELERQLEGERDDNERTQRSLREENTRLNIQLEESFRDFTDLMNTKIQLDQEILMYRKMLEGEESRLNIKSPARQSSFTMSSTKRRRISGDDYGEIDTTQMPLSGSALTPGSSTKARFIYRVTSNAKGGIEFSSQQDGLGKWVKLINSSNEDVNMGNWTIKQIADDQESTYKFHRSLTLKPGGECTIWSSDSTTTHNPPSDIVMKNQTFHTGQNISLSLMDQDLHEQATCNVSRERLRQTGSNVAFSRRSGYKRPSQEEKCHIM